MYAVIQGNIQSYSLEEVNGYLFHEDQNIELKSGNWM